MRLNITRRDTCAHCHGQGFIEAGGTCPECDNCLIFCPDAAISRQTGGRYKINYDYCKGCGVCVTECPRGKAGNLLELVPETGAIAVRCSSRDKVKARRGYCTMSCIACKKCERVCPSDAIHVIDMLAVVDYEKCTACLACVEVCPQNCIDVTGRASGKTAAVTDGKAGAYDGFAPTVAVAASEEADEA